MQPNAHEHMSMLQALAVAHCHTAVWQAKPATGWTPAHLLNAGLPWQCGWPVMLSCRLCLQPRISCAESETSLNRLVARGCMAWWAALGSWARMMASPACCIVAVGRADPPLIGAHGRYSLSGQGDRLCLLHLEAA